MPSNFEKVTLDPTGICILLQHKYHSTENSLTESKFCPSAGQSIKLTWWFEDWDELQMHFHLHYEIARPWN